MMVFAHAKNHTCASALIMRSGKILMGLRKYKDKPLWVFPGGRCDFGETPEEGLKREVAEEIGVADIEIVRLIEKKEGAYRDGTGVDEVYMFECHTDENPKLLEPEKFVEWRWIGLEEIPLNIIDISDTSRIKSFLLGRQHS